MQKDQSCFLIQYELIGVFDPLVGEHNRIKLN